MKKLALFAGGAGAAVAMAVIGAGNAHANPPDVTGEAYGKAVSILHAQGYSSVFGGSVGSDLPQSQCIVSQQKTLGTGAKQQLMLDCTLAPGQEKPGAPNTHSLVPPGGSVPTSGADAPSRPTPGAGTVTVTPVPIG
ncbi:hypothetical protein BH09ACT7_BH09ACT7_22900 [soil metagenome]